MKTKKPKTQKMTKEMVLALQPGDRVKWSSQSGGRWVEKAGIVLAQVPTYEDAIHVGHEEALRQGAVWPPSKTRMKFQRSAKVHRVLVAVGGSVIGGLGRATFYAPDVGRLCKAEKL